MHLFTGIIEDQKAFLNEEESQHCARVLRMQVGQAIAVTDGQGSWCEAELRLVNPKGCIAEILSIREIPKRDHYIHLVCAPTKNMDRFEWLLEKITELGIDEITPVFTAHSERTTLKSERCEKVILSALKQSQNVYLPKFNEALKFKDLITKIHWDGDFYIGYCGDDFEKKGLFETASASDKKQTLIWIGPEGDFSADEVRQCVEKGAKVISLGNTRLRTETAGIIAVHSLILASVSR